MQHFFRSSNVHGNVVFNFNRTPIDDLSAFAQGYHNAGKKLADQIAAARGYPDYDGYPILFLYRHALELYLKAIIYRGAMLLKLVSNTTIDAERLMTKHELTVFLPAIRAIFEAQEWNWEFDVSGLETFDDFCDLVKEIERIDPRSYSFRYPTSKKGTAALEHHFVINVLSFARNMDGVLELLSGAVTGLDESWDKAASIQYFIQELFREERG
jgi:hypothetical protein